MKLLHFSTEKHWRGGEQQIAYLIEELSKKGIDNFLLCRKNSEMERYALKNQIAHQAISIRNSVDIMAILKAAQIFKKLKPDCIHLHTSKAHSIGLFAHTIGQTQRFILHRRVSFTIKQSRINKWKYNHSAIERVVCISQDVKRQVEKIVNREAKLTVIYSGIDLNKFKNSGYLPSIKKEFGITKEDFLITGIGALNEEKDFETFIKTAANTLKKLDNIHFLIVGKGPEDEKLKLLVKELSLKDKLSFTGFRTDIPQILHDSDAFMLCSKSEGLGTSFIDAAAAGCVLIGTNAGGIPEIIDQGQNGYFENIGDHTALSERLLEVLKDKSKLKQMGIKAQEKAQKFSIEKMLDEYINLYKALNKNV